MLVPKALSPQDDAVYQAVLNHQIHWNVFFRELFGCPMTAATSKECRLAYGKINYKEFNASCESAKRLWKLKGECR